MYNGAWGVVYYLNSGIPEPQVQWYQQFHALYIIFLLKEQGESN